CRTGHAYLGEYYSKFVPLKNIDCPCGKDFQTWEHVLWGCPQYEHHRHILREVSEDVLLSDILGMEKGILALVDFLKVSGALTQDGTMHKPPEEPKYK
ncbi:hypothetical protein BT96DRAFT_794553, partial [Gymnopus androsaceus JB14]